MAARARKQSPEPSPSPLAEMGWPDWADPQASQTLRRALRDGKITHAYLLSGPAGVGKSALARAFAQSLCCTSSVNGDRSQPCSTCRACRNVVRGVHPDVERFDLETQAILAEKGASQTTLSIDTVRRLRSSAALLPLEAGRRVVVIDDAETMLEPAQQALLKTLEEPPPAVTILLLSDDAETLLETVRSRCHEVHVRPVSEAAVTRALAQRGLDDTEAEDIASLSRGAPAWAIAAASDARLVQTRKAERDAAKTWLMAGNYDQLVTAFKLGEQFGKRRGEVIGIVLAATQMLRERMIGAAGAGLTDSATEVSVLELSKAVAASLRCLADLDANVRPRLALEAMVVQWPMLDPIPD